MIEAARTKYAVGLDIESSGSIRIGGKEVEEIGFDKIQQQISDLESLRIVVLDGLCIAGPATDCDPIEQRLSSICPKIVELDISRNLFESADEVLRIIGGLEHLKSLKLDGNRFSGQIGLLTQMHTVPPYSTLQSLSLDETLLKWDEVSSTPCTTPRLL